MAAEPEIFWTARFQNNYERYNGQRARIRARVNELRNWNIDFIQESILEKNFFSI